MADRYWRGGTGTWNSTSTTNWSATSGGAGGASVPTSADDVYFNSSSGTGTVTLSGSIVCRSLNFTGTTLTFTGSGSVFLEFYGNFTMGTGATLGANLGQLQHRAAGGTWTFTSNGKTLPWSVIGFYGSASAVMNIQDAITTTGQIVPSGANTVNFGAFTHTCASWNLSGAQTSNFTSPGKVVISRSTSGTGVATPSSSLTNYAISTYNRFEILSPPAGVTVTNSGWGRVETRTPKLYFIASGSGTIATVGPTTTGSSMGAPWSVDVGAGSYSIQGVSACRSLTISPSYTGTITNIVAMFSVDSTGCTMNLGTSRTMNAIFYAFAVNSGTNPNYLDTSATFTNDGGSPSQIINGVFTLRNNSVLTVANLRIEPNLLNSNIDFGSGSGKIVIDGSGFTLSSYTNIPSTGFLNYKPFEISTSAPSGSTTITLPDGFGGVFAKSLSFTTTGTGTNTITFNGSSLQPHIRNLTIANSNHNITATNMSQGAMYILGDMTFGGSTCGPGIFPNYPVAFVSSTSPQYLTTNGAQVYFYTWLNNSSASPLTLLGNVASGSGQNHIDFRGAGYLNLNNYSFQVARIDITGTMNIDFGTTGKIRLYNNSSNSVDVINVTTDTVVGTITGSRTIEVEPFGTLAQGYWRQVYYNTINSAKYLNLTVVNNGSTGPVSISLWSGDMTFENGPYTLNGTNNTFIITPISFPRAINFLGTSPNFYNSSFQTSGTAGSSLNTNGNVLNVDIVSASSGNTLTLAGAASIRSMSVNAGTLQLGSFTLTCSTSFSTSGSTSNAINFGTGSIYLTSATSATVWSVGSVTSVSGTSRQVYVTTPNSGQTKTLTTAAAITDGFDFETVIVGSGGTVNFSDGNFRNFTVAGGTYTIGLPNSYSIYGDLTVNGAVTAYTGSTGTLTFNKTSGTQLISTNGNEYGGLGTTSFAQTNTTFQLNSNSSFRGPITLSTGTLNLNNFRLIGTTFNSSGTNTRTINFVTSGAIRLTGSGTVFNTSTSSSLTVSGTNRFVEPNLNSAQTLTFGSLAEANTFDVSVPTTASNNTLTISTGNNVRSLTFSNVAYTVANTALNIYGNLTVLGTTPVFTAGSNTWTFLASSGTQTITSGGETFNFPITCNVTGTLALGDNVTVGSSNIFTLTTGTLSLGTRTLSTGFFTSTNSNVRTISFGTGGQIALTGTGTVWNSATITNLTTTGTTKTIAPQLTAAQTLNFGALSEANAFDVSVPATAGNFTLSTVTSDGVRNLTFANATYTVSFSPLTVYGSFTVAGTSPTFASTNSVVTFAATSGSHSITTNGETLDFPITINAPGATYTAGSALTMGSTRRLTLTQGTFNTGNFSISTGEFNSSGSSARTLTLGSSTWTIVGSGASAWDVTTSTNMTLNRGTSKISMNSASNKTFNGGGLTYGILEQAGAGTLTVTGTSNRFADLQRSFAGVNTISLPNGVTTFFDDFTLTGVSAASRTTLTAPGVATISKSSGTVSVNFLSISFSSATGGASWYAGTGSVQGSSVTGWIFTAPPQASGNMLMVFM